MLVCEIPSNNDNNNNKTGTTGVHEFIYRSQFQMNKKERDGKFEMDFKRSFC